MSQRLPRAIVAAVTSAVLVLFGLIQLASMAFVHAPNTLSSLIPQSFGRRVYLALDRVAPAPFVEETLAEDALARGELDAALHFATRLHASSRRDDLLGRIAEARGDSMLAREYYFAAPDVDRMQQSIRALARVDAPGAYEMEVRFAQRLASLQRHPDALAQAYFAAGNFADWLGWRAKSIENYKRALALAPFDITYLLNAGSEAYVSGDFDLAKQFYARGLSVNPACADCFAGLGMVAFRQGDHAQARTYAARARAAGSKSAMLRALDALLR